MSARYVALAPDLRISYPHGAGVSARFRLRSSIMRLFKNSMLALTAAAALTVGLAAPTVQAARNTVTYAMYGDVKDWDPSVAFSLEVMNSTER